MSRFIKIFTLYIIVLLSTSSCGGNKNIDYQQDKTKQVIQDDVENIDVDNIYKQTIEQAIPEDVVVNEIQYNPVDVVDGVLKKPSKKIHIGLVVPMTGKYASVGKMIAESAMMTINKSKFDDVGVINVYNITNLKNENWKDNPEIKKMLKDDNDVIIGAGENFEDTTKKLLSVIPEDKLFISFINNDELAKKYSNLVVLGVDERYKIHTLFQYLRDYKRQFVSLILPATKKGYDTEKMFRKLAPNYEVFIVSSQFYQAKSKPSILAATRGVGKNFRATYIIDENGRFSTETYKQNKQRQQEMLNNPSASISAKNMTKKQTVNVNAIYIDAEENDLITILNSLDRIGILNKNVQLFSNAVIDVEHSTSTKLENVLYVGYNYNVIDSFNKNFVSYFNRSPNYFSYLTYDTLSMLFYVSSMWNMVPRQIYTEDGFLGILDEFRFTREGNIERRMSIYKLRNQIMSRVFVPEDYISIEVLKGGNGIYFK